MTTSFNDTTPYDLTAALDSGYALSLNGNMDITEVINDVSGFNDDLYLAVNDVDRFVGISLLRPTYYIRTEYDINAKVAMFPGNDAGNTGIDNNGNDDAWTLDGFSVGLLGSNGADTATTTNYKLPTGTGSVNIANITASDDDQSFTYELDFSLSVSDQGVLTVTNAGGQDSINAWTGSNNVGLINDDITKAQAAYWTNDTTANIALGAAQNPVVASANAPGINDVDTLLAILTKAQVAAYYNDDTNTALDLFDGHTIYNDWTITIDSIGNDTESNLSAYARNRFTGEASTPNANPFKTGDQIVANEPHSFSLSVTDNNGEVVPLVSATDVYGVVYQS